VKSSNLYLESRVSLGLNAAKALPPIKFSGPDPFTCLRMRKLMDQRFTPKLREEYGRSDSLAAVRGDSRRGTGRTT
jgi:hypothetical protein